MSQVPPPALGFNNNVRHGGRLFHIQTEDSGIKSPRIVTHLFADGGHIIKTTRTEYADIVDRADLAQLVREMMKSQHKAMFSALHAGELDTLLEQTCGPLPLNEAGAAESGAVESVQPAATRQGPGSGQPAGAISSQVPESTPATTRRSIFGDAMISEKSLDEVILSYLAEDLEGSE